jgi:hypothetical protein
MSHPGLPTVLATSQLLAGLINKPVQAHFGEGKALEKQAGGCFIGVYDDGKGNTEAAWFSDMPLSASLGAALTLLPKNMAQAAVTEKKLSQEMLDNLREVVNVSASVFTEKRVRLVKLYGPLEKVPPEVTAFAQGKVKRQEMTIDVGSYFLGNLVLLVNADETTG